MVWQNSSAYWAVKNFAKVGGVASVVSASVTECVGVLVCPSNTKVVVVLSSIFPQFGITRTMTLRSRGILSESPVGTRDRTSVTLCLPTALCITSKSNSDGRSRQSANLPIASAKFKIYQANHGQSKW